MGVLARVLKRKLGDAHGDGQQKRQSSGPAATAPPHPVEALRQTLANGGFAALVASHTSKSTRTALRKQRKAQQLAAERVREERQRQRQPQLGAARQGSDSEDDGDAAHVAANGDAVQGGSSGVEQDGLAPAAYDRLLGSLVSAGGAHADALQRRRREQAGDSDASSDEASEELGGSEDNDSDLEEDASGGDGEEEEQQEEELSDGGDEPSGEAHGGEGLAPEGPREAASSEDEDSGDEAGTSDAAADGRQADDGSPAGAAAEDHYAPHFDGWAG